MTKAHVRIDEGVKRGPRKPGTGLRSPKADLGTWVIPPDLDPREILDRYLTEATTGQIAAQYGLSRKALTKWLRQTVPAEWKETQLIRAHTMIEQGEDGILDAPDALSLARMRETVKAAQFRLQALDPDYHPKQELRVEHVGDLGDRLRRSRERVIDVSPAPQQLDKPQSNQGADSVNSSVILQESDAKP